MNVTVAVDTAGPELERRIAALRNRKRLGRVAGAGVQRSIVRWIRRELVPRGNQMGAPSTGFWQKAARSTTLTSDESGATVAITARGVALQYYGGTVTPGKSISEKTGKPTVYLAIPARTESYGKSPGEMPFLHFVFGSNASALADESGLVMFWLVRSATIRPHPDILPSAEEMRAAAAAAVKGVL